MRRLHARDLIQLTRSRYLVVLLTGTHNHVSDAGLLRHALCACACHAMHEDDANVQTSMDAH